MANEAKKTLVVGIKSNSQEMKAYQLDDDPRVTVVPNGQNNTASIIKSLGEQCLHGL